MELVHENRSIREINVKHFYQISVLGSDKQIMRYT